MKSVGERNLPQFTLYHYLQKHIPTRYTEYCVNMSAKTWIG